MDPLLPLVTALVAGFLHALEPDHMAAVTTFVSRRPQPLAALGFGLRWGIGHALAVVAVGGVLVLLDLEFPSELARGLEFGVGGILVLLGAWLLWTVLHDRAHAHVAPSGGVPGHDHRHEHDHGRKSGWVGVVHGLAGTAPLLAVLPVTLISSPALSFSYLLLFGAGTVASMAIYAWIAGILFQRAGQLPRLAEAIRVSTAVGSALIGVFWMYSALAPA